MSVRVFLWVAGLGLVFDQLVKAWVRSLAEGVEGRSLFVLWPHVFELKLVFNEGIAFGMFQGAGVLLTPIAAVIAVGAAVFSFRNRQEGAATHVAMALLCAGALGNLVDRLAFGKVTDMFWFRAIDFPVFNVADVCITIAGVMMALSVFAEIGRGKHKSEPAVADPVCSEDSSETSDPPVATIDGGPL